MLNMADRAAQDTVRDSDEDLMVEEVNMFKVPVLKRKQVNESGMEEEVCAEDSQPQTEQLSAESQQPEKH